jgi:hypothetical protein
MIDKKLIFDESWYSEIKYKQNIEKLSDKQNEKRKPYIKCCVDANVLLYEIEKNKQINELRRDIYFDEDYWSLNTNEK